MFTTFIEAFSCAGYRLDYSRIYELHKPVDANNAPSLIDYLPQLQCIDGFLTKSCNDWGMLRGLYRG